MQLRVAERIKLIDDYEYACRYVADRSARGYGPVRIRVELRQRGISDEDIESAMEELPDAAEMIERFIISRARQIPMDRSDSSRISGALAQQGFSVGRYHTYITQIHGGAILNGNYRTGFAGLRQEQNKC